MTNMQKYKGVDLKTDFNMYIISFGALLDTSLSRGTS